MVSSSLSPFRRGLFVALLSLSAGGAAGWAGASLAVSGPLARVEDALRRSIDAPSGGQATSTPVQIIPVEPAGERGGLPPALRVGRATPTLPIFKLDARPVDEFFSPQEALVPAVALTADGWLAVPPGALPAALRLADLAVGWRGTLLVPTKGVRDAATGVVFLKIEARDLPVAALASRLEVEAGQAVWRESRSDVYAPASVLRIGAATSGSALLSSDQWNRRFLLGGPSVSAAVVWNADGRLVGLTGSGAASDAVLPADALRPALASLLTDGEIRHPSLGVHYLDLAEGFTRGPVRNLPAQGALLKGDRRLAPAIVPNGPAALGLREGDVIERIERDVLDGTWTLAERIFDYRPGATVTVAGLREGKPFEAQVVLRSVATGEALK